MNPASNLILIGPTGAGKSTVGARLAAHYALPFVDLDREIERRSGSAVATIFERVGEAGFRAHEQALLRELLTRDGIVLATGGGAVLDAGNRALLRDRGFVVHLQVDPATQLQRLVEDGSRPLLAGTNRAAVLDAMATARTPLYAQIADLALDTGGIDEATVLARLLAQLNGGWQRRGAA